MAWARASSHASWICLWTWRSSGMRTALISDRHHFWRCSWSDQSLLFSSSHQSCPSQLLPCRPHRKISDQTSRVASIKSLRLLVSWCLMTMDLHWDQSKSNSTSWAISSHQHLRWDHHRSSSRYQHQTCLHQKPKMLSYGSYCHLCLTHTPYPNKLLIYWATQNSICLSKGYDGL